jgi:hypothetical protein
MQAFFSRLNSRRRQEAKLNTIAFQFMSDLHLEVGQQYTVFHFQIPTNWTGSRPSWRHWKAR